MPFLILFSSCFVSQLDLDLVLSQKMPATTIPNSQQIAKKKDSQEKELPLLFSFTFSFFHPEASERAQEKRVCRDAPHLRADDRRTDPQIANESKREHLMRYLRDILLPDFSLSFWSKKSSLLPYRTRGGRDEHFLFVPKKHKTTNRDDNDNERTRYKCESETTDRPCEKKKM